MNKSKRKRFLSAIALCTVSAAMLMTTACGKPASGGRIAVICKTQGVSFWDDVKKGAEDAGEELGYDIDYYIASGDNDYASQIEYINEAIDNKVKAIVIAPNGNSELDEAFEKAEKAGIKLININSRTDYEGVISLISSSDSDGGAVAARNAASLMLGNVMLDGNFQVDAVVGKVGIIAHTAATADQRVSGFRTEFSSQLASYIETVKFNNRGQFGGFGGEGFRPDDMGGPEAATDAAAETANADEEGSESAEAATEAATTAAEEGGNGIPEGIVPPDAAMGEFRTEEQTAELIESYILEGERCSTVDASYQEAKKLLQENEDIRIMFATNTNTTLGVCQAIEELGLSETVIVIGFNSDEKEISYLKTGVLDGTIIQNPYNMGYVGISYAIKSINDEAVPNTLDTGVTFVDASNLNDDYIQLLLYPDKY